LEDAHLVVADEHGRLDIIAVLQLAAEMRALAANDALRSFLLADVDVVKNLLQLAVRGLGAHHRARIEGIAHLDFADPRHGFLHEAVENRVLDQSA
jgi:ParB family chromosome partitioning protein